MPGDLRTSVVRVTSPGGLVDGDEVSVLGFSFPGPRSWLWSPAQLQCSAPGAQPQAQHDSPPSFTVELVCRHPSAEPFVQELRDVSCSPAVLE